MHIDGFQMNHDHSGYRSEHPHGQLNETLHSVRRDGKYSKLSALQMGQRKLKPPWTLVHEISDSSAAVARV